jgi:hypothetical protein
MISLRECLQGRFWGFLVNSYNPIKAELNSQKLVINPVEGSFIFFYDFDTL